MAEYRKIEYRIGKDGKIVETVLNASGAGCTETTSAIEQALGEVESQELLPQYYETEVDLETDETQSLTQM
ncbi:DUF2997 domain-containing protein [Leptolyngbya sp. FACHB-671]|uniref:DUF2997 domain-containing protein n=1 Tax=Leptolyngbya sp. FACHB-671 TaxID=2692812 RepID=UPI001685AC25|nr:DUF2997 domain-containing protein [Leptolyngbya sp. FACHB-671]MBD2066838.1 DUF2997 domain-containing protein [Leptolyngbya sp. FACHB-671]